MKKKYESFNNARKSQVWTEILKQNRQKLKDYNPFKLQSRKMYVCECMSLKVSKTCYSKFLRTSPILKSLITDEPFFCFKAF